MILLSFESAAARRPQIVLVFGSGLVGSAILEAVQRTGHLLHKRHLSWTWPQPTSEQSQAVHAAVQDCLEQRPSAGLNVIWAAGRSGFGSSKEDMSLEYEAFSHVRALARGLPSPGGQTLRRFFHISSAGGLFEGQVACEKDATPKPIRPYGHGKLHQEQAVQDDTGLGARLIMRPSSVFGYVARGRLGLVSALISAALQHREAHIFGAFHTQRDFIFAPDIGRYLAGQIFTRSQDATDLDHVLLASGRPASVFEIIKTVEDVVGTPLYLKINAHPDNALDNTFRASALPPGFFPTPLREGIEQTKSTMEVYSFDT